MTETPTRHRPHAPSPTHSLSPEARGPLHGEAAASRSPGPGRNGRPVWQRWLVITLGWVFIALGIAGLVLPFLQGILFLLIGLVLLSRELVWAHRLKERIYDRWPKLRELSDKGEEWMDRQWRKVRGFFGRA